MLVHDSGTTLAHDRPQNTAVQVPIEGHGAPENPVPGPGGAVYTYANDGADGASPLVSLWAPSPGRCRRCEHKPTLIGAHLTASSALGSPVSAVVF